MAARAIFLDRDGTLSEEVGYVNHLSRFRLFPWAAEAVRLIRQLGFKAIVATNQAGVARGYFTEELVHEVHARMQADLEAAGAPLNAVYVCMHHPTAGSPPYRLDCDCRKPKTGMIDRAREQFDLDLSQSYFIGDKYLDVRVAHGVGSQGILVLSGYGRGEWTYQSHTWSRPPDHIAETLLDAVTWIARR
ncbi:MAG: HAD family hydrolase [Acidobacteria bacterium]|nr:HAD family hydrolase [Acidobacteriota bacterium]